MTTSQNQHQSDVDWLAIVKSERIPALKILLTTSMGCSNHIPTILNSRLKTHHPNGVNLHKKCAYFLKRNIL